MNELKRLSALVALLCAVWLMSLADAIGDFKASKAINQESTAVFIMDLKNNRTLASHNISKPLIPASIMKGVTVATLLDKVGPKFQFLTPVYTVGKISGGVLDGNLLVEAVGDPSINSKHQPDISDFAQEIAEALAGEGITRIRGSVLVDESDFPGPAVNPSWSSGDLPHYYGTGTHGFNFADNANGKKSVSDPVALFRSALMTAFAKAGIAIDNEKINVSSPKTLLFEHESASLDEIMRSCMMRSDNQYAEAFLRQVGLKYGGSGSTAEGTRQEMKYWTAKKASTDSVVIVDGSGLSRSNRLTAKFMADVLKKMAANPYYASFFPLAGQEGTLKNLLAGTPLEGYIAMKTGSMNGIQCYAGYKLDDDYSPTHVVVFIMNDLKDRTAARKEVEKLLLSLFE